MNAALEFSGKRTERILHSGPSSSGQNLHIKVNICDLFTATVFSKLAKVFFTSINIFHHRGHLLSAMESTYYLKFVYEFLFPLSGNWSVIKKSCCELSFVCLHESIFTFEATQYVNDRVYPIPNIVILHPSKAFSHFIVSVLREINCAAIT